MAKVAKMWKKGRGRLGVLEPLQGRWLATAQSPQGRVQCTRTFSRVLQGAYVQLVAEWKYGKTRYDEIALIGPGDDGKLTFWSFTSDGKRSSGTIADAGDFHPEAVGFEAQMPAGLARMAYWPEQGGGFGWAVESKTKKGWKRFTEHHYKEA